MSIIDTIEGTVLKLFNGTEVDLVEIFAVDVEDLSIDFSQQAALYAYFSTLTVEAERQLALAKFDTEQQYAAADNKWRHYKDRREEKYTEAVIRSLILQDSDYYKAEERRIQLDYEASLLKSISRALAQRADMLISLGAMTRQEMAMTGMNMREKVLNDLPKDLRTIVKSAIAKKERDQV